MENRRAPRTNYTLSFLFFGLTGFISILLLLTASVVWLTKLTGSLMAALLIVGGACGFLSLLTYVLVIREALDRISQQMETMYEVSRLLHSGYEWVTQKLILFLNFNGQKP